MFEARPSVSALEECMGVCRIGRASPADGKVCEAVTYDNVTSTCYMGNFRQGESDPSLAASFGVGTNVVFMLPGSRTKIPTQS